MKTFKFHFDAISLHRGIIHRPNFLYLLPVVIHRSFNIIELKMVPVVGSINVEIVNFFCSFLHIFTPHILYLLFVEVLKAVQKQNFCLKFFSSFSFQFVKVLHLVLLRDYKYPSVPLFFTF